MNNNGTLRDNQDGRGILLLVFWPGVVISSFGPVGLIAQVAIGGSWPSQVQLLHKFNFLTTTFTADHRIVTFTCCALIVEAKSYTATGALRSSYKQRLS